ncbi:MAG: ATP synthase subunit I, partial [Ruminococcus sp.]|nr:ATP synthase subunit I [Ruminococcus sp.]
MKNTKDQMKSCCRNKESYLMPVFKKLVAIMALLNVLFYCLSLFWGFSFKTLLGFLIGYIYVNLCYAYVAHTVEKSVNFDVKRAKRAMYVCFAVRYTGLFLLCFVAMQFKLFHVIGIIIPQ